MSHDLVLHLRSEETLRNVERTAEALGLPVDEFAEAALQIAVLGADLNGRLERLSERLREYDEGDLEQDIQEFARSEVAYEDPLQARRLTTKDPYGIGALFAHPVERG